jgi:hypothetical protein
MNIRPYVEVTPPHIKTYRDRADYGSQSAIAPKNPNAPMQFWSDTSLQGGAGLLDYWSSFLEPAATPQGTKAYKFIARDEKGKPKLTAINSRDFYATYESSLSIVNTYREFSFMFPLGVPYLEEKQVPTTEASTVNVEGGTLPARDYPVEFRTDTMFVIDPKTGDVGVIQYQEFIKAARSVVTLTDDQKIATIRGICDSPMPAAAKLDAIRVAAQKAPVAGEVI